jgi:ligand-binding sensor domain-containing protein
VNRLLVLLVAACSFFSAKANAAPPAPALPALDIAALAATPDRLYVAGFDAGLFIVERDGQTRRFEHAALGHHINALSWSERTRSLWLGTARGLVRCQMAPVVSCRQIGPRSAVHALLLRPGDQLLAGGDAGLLFVDHETSRVFGKKQGAPFRSVWALGESDGALFVGSTNGLFWGDARSFVSGGHKLERASLVNGNLPDDWVTALLRQGERLFVGTYNAGVVSFRLQDRQLLSVGADASLGYVNPAGLSAVDETTQVVASMDGLRAGAMGRTALLKTKGRDVTAVTPATGGGYWVGTRRGLEWLERLEP